MLPPFRIWMPGLLLVALTAALANAQPRGVTYQTLEARIAEAENVVVGTIAKAQRKVIVAPGARGKDGQPDFNGQMEYTPILKVDETLKGNLKGTVSDLRTVQSYGYDHRYEEWSKAQTVLLWFLDPTPKAGKQRGWSIIPLGKVVPAEAIFGGREKPLIWSRDFTRLDDDQAVLARARNYAKTSTRVLPTHVLRVPTVVLYGKDNFNVLNDYIVPLEPALEAFAKRFILSPQEFLPKGAKFSARSRFELRSSGVSTLRHFKSQANIDLLRKLLDEPPEKFQGIGIPPFPLRTLAYKILLGWGVKGGTPKSAEDITSLDLSGTQVTDEGLQQLIHLKNLSRLELQNTPITAKGLKTLANLKNLRSLHLEETQLTDANLGALAEVGLLHTLRAAGGQNGKRPSTDQDITYLELYRAPLTDAVLRHFTGLKNLTALYLDDSQVTGAGLSALVPLGKLTRLHLRHAPVTDAGLKELANLKSLTHLALKDTNITAVGLKELTRLDNLVELDLSNTPIAGADLKALAGMKSLELLHLSNAQMSDATLQTLRQMDMLHVCSHGGTDTEGQRPKTAGEVTWFALMDTSVTDAGLKEIAALKNLTTLQLINAKMTGTGLQELAGLTKLTNLFVKNTPLSDAGVRAFANLKSLRTLHMHDANITDARLRVLGEIGMLHVLYDAGSRTNFPPGTWPPRAKSDAAVKSLDLSYTDVTDIGLKALATLKNLARLRLRGTNVTAAGIAALLRELPNCKVER